MFKIAAIVFKERKIRRMGCFKFLEIPLQAITINSGILSRLTEVNDVQVHDLFKVCFPNVSNIWSYIFGWISWKFWMLRGSLHSCSPIGVPHDLTVTSTESCWVLCLDGTAYVKLFPVGGTDALHSGEMSAVGPTSTSGFSVLLGWLIFRGYVKLQGSKIITIQGRLLVNNQWRETHQSFAARAPTPIQAYTWPVLMNSKEGSGRWWTGRRVKHFTHIMYQWLEM